MAWLFLDTHAPGQARFAILEEGSLPKITSIEGRTVGLLPKLSKVLGNKGLKKLQGVCVVAGPGSFSSVRAGVLDANMIARLLKIPLVGVTVDEVADLPVLSHKLFATHHSIKMAEYVAPIYDKEPNITMPKKLA
ncbi:hypothetical protein K8R04_03685 [Candidatus Uhrbacteria bacterium]|nr:hypothetical protein [Candidatus Uhrbacteria bacterium]